MIKLTELQRFHICKCQPQLCLECFILGPRVPVGFVQIIIIIFIMIFVITYPVSPVMFSLCLQIIM